MDNMGNKVDYSDADLSPSFGDRAKATTTRVLALFFIIARSVMFTAGDPDVFRTMAAVMRDGPFTAVWWERYWKGVVRRIGVDDGNGDVHVPKAMLGDGVRAVFKAVLRDVIDEDMAAIVEELVQQPITHSICAEKTCHLHNGKMVFQRCT